MTTREPPAEDYEPCAECGFDHSYEPTEAQGAHAAVIATPWQRLVASGEVSPIDGWDWRAAVPMWVWHRISIGVALPDAQPHCRDLARTWDRIDGSPPFVLLEHSGVGTSRNIAIAWDNEASCLFYYRDWTRSGLPFGLEDRDRSSAILRQTRHGRSSRWRCKLVTGFQGPASGNECST